MPTVIDSLIIALNLDPSDFNKGQKAAVKSLLDTKKSAEKAAADIEKANVKAAKASEKAARDMAAAAKKAAKDQEEANKKTRESAEEARKSILTLTAAFLGGESLKKFVENSIQSNTALGNLSTSLGTTSQFAAAFGIAAARMGGSAASAQASLQTLADQLTDLRTQGQNLPMSVFLLGAQSKQAIDYAHGVKEYAASLANAASVLAKTDPTAANRYLRAIGIDPATAAMMIKLGPKYRDFVAMQKKLTPSDKDVASAQAMTMATGELSAEYDQLATKIMTALSPALIGLMKALGSLVEDFSKFVEKHPDITKAFAAVAAILSGASILLAIKNVLGLKDAILALTAANEAGAAGGLLGGLLGKLTKLGLIGGGIAALGVGAIDAYEHSQAGAGEDERQRQRQYGGGSGNEAIRRRGAGAIGKLAQNANARAVIEELRKAGYNDNAIAAVVGSMQTESMFNPRAHNSVAGGHTGAWQWDATRWPKVAAWIRGQGGDPYDYRWQAKAWIAEHNAKPGDAIYDNTKTEAGGAILRNNPTLDQAVHGVRLSERFGAGEEGGRARHAAEWLPHLNENVAAAHAPRGIGDGSVPPMPANMPHPAWKGQPVSSLGFGAAHTAALNNISNDNRATTTSSSNEMHINAVNIHAPNATNSREIASSINSELGRYYGSTANYGPA